MTANRIVECALSHFAENGYEGASLSNIADKVGIKTPSIYAHFKSKDELFLNIIDNVIDHEMHFLTRYFADNDKEPLQDRLLGFFMQYNDRYEHSDRVKFLFRFMLFPPVSLQPLIADPVYSYLDKLEELLIPVFSDALLKGELAEDSEKNAAISFICLLDGLLAERMYGGTERFKKRLDASWAIYWRGLTKK